MTWQARIGILLSLIFGALRAFANIPDDLEVNVRALIDSGYFLSMWVARGGLVLIQDVFSATRLTSLVGAVVSLARVFFPIPDEVEHALHEVTAAVYGIVAMLMGRGLQKDSLVRKGVVTVQALKKAA